jgi:membrane protein
MEEGIMTRSLNGMRRYVGVFGPFFWRNFIHDRILLSAGSLAFQTLLSLVPLLAVILSILKAFPVFTILKRSIKDFIFQNFVPGQGAMLQTYLWQFIDKAATVPTIGGIFLFIIAMFLISTVDHTLNGIWEVNSPRKILQGFTLYWTVLTIGPVFIGTSLVASSYVWYMVFTGGPLHEMKTKLLSYIPFVNSIVAFFLLYMLVPNRRVRFRHAFAGALLAAVLFELSKKWFLFYVSHFATFEHIYGALSVVPMLFFWVYLSWVVVLTGAEIVFCLGAVFPSPASCGTFDPLKGLPEILNVLGRIWTGQKRGQYLNMKRMLVPPASVDRTKLRRIVDFLLQNDVIHLTARGELSVSGDLHSLTLYDLYARIPPDIIRGENGDGTAGGGDALDLVRDRVREALREGMQVPLATLLQDSKPTAS